MKKPVTTDDSTDPEQARACDPQAAKPSATKKRHRRFTQADVQRAVKGAIKGGLTEIWRVRIAPDGAITIETGKLDGVTNSRDDLDQELTEFEARHGQG